jgi:hypothetical protein
VAVFDRFRILFLLASHMRKGDKNWLTDSIWIARNGLELGSLRMRAMPSNLRGISSEFSRGLKAEEDQPERQHARGRT